MRFTITNGPARFQLHGKGGFEIWVADDAEELRAIVSLDNGTFFSLGATSTFNVEVWS